MRQLATFLFACSLVLVPAAAQERAGAKKPPTFAEAVEQAKKAVDADKVGAAIAALQAAMRDLQKKQRAQVLECLPKPDGWQVHDDTPEEAAGAMALGIAAMGMTVNRRYENGDKNIQVEVMANSPLIQMVAMMFSNPALVEAQGGEIVKYGAHRAILQKSGDDGHELQLLMHDVHLIKITARGIDADAMLKMFDQAFVDRLEKPLGK